MTLSAQFFVSIITIVVVANLILLACAYLIFLERKVASWSQDRIGPNRTNFSFGLNDIWKMLRINWLFEGRRHFGLGQALADGLKLLFKEDYSPPHVDRGLFYLAPALAVIPALVAWAVVPWGGYFNFPGLVLGPLTVEPGLVSVAVAPVNIGVIFILAVSSLAVYGVTLGGYASNNKYSFFGGLRATAQMLSYEIPMGLIVLVAVLTLGTFNAGELVAMQSGWLGGAWGVLTHPLLAILFFVCILAESNRAPFDLAEAEQELVGGFHTEYSSMKWALFFLAEYMHMITGCAFLTLLFLGGWSLNPIGFVLPFDLPLVGETFWVGLLGVLLKFGIFLAKVGLLLFAMMWVRWTLPRLRFDQLMKLAWRGLIPLSLLALLIKGMVVFADLPARGVWFLLGDILLLAGALTLGPLLPKGPDVNRRVRMEGSRFYPPQPEAG